MTKDKLSLKGKSLEEASPVSSVSPVSPVSPATLSRMIFFF
jgi:hypothetical protein